MGSRFVEAFKLARSNYEWLTALPNPPLLAFRTPATLPSKKPDEVNRTPAQME
jgi:hypothetical protein